MPDVCMYFQVHQPFRLRGLRVFDSPAIGDYFDTERNDAILRKVADRCYLPTNAVLLELIERFHPLFRVAFSISGVAMQQFEQSAPDVLESFQRLVDTGCVELLGETSHHSLASIYLVDEFFDQVRLHRDACQRHFGVTSQVFRNTELVYSDAIGRLASEAGFRGVLAEGADDILGWRSPNYVYEHPDAHLAVLLKNYRLSDDVAFRFSDRAWPEYPLTADRYAQWIHAVSGSGTNVNLFMDYETFGEHQWAESGIFAFLTHLPEAILKHPDWRFATPSELIREAEPVAPLSFGRLTSWADVDRDLTAWIGNALQTSSIDRIYRLHERVVTSGDSRIIDTWRKLQTSDHFYYMCTKWAADGDVHAYFSPYDSPYDAYITFQNVLHHFEEALAKGPGVSTPPTEVAHTAIAV